VTEDGGLASLPQELRLISVSTLISGLGGATGIGVGIVNARLELTISCLSLTVIAGAIAWIQAQRRQAAPTPARAVLHSVSMIVVTVCLVGAFARWGTIATTSSSLGAVTVAAASVRMTLLTSRRAQRVVNAPQ